MAEDTFLSRIEDMMKAAEVQRGDISRRSASRTQKRKKNLDELYSSEGKKRSAPKPLPDPGEPEGEDTLRPKDPQRGTGAMLRKGQSFSEAMSLGESAKRGTPLPDPGEPEEEDILRPKDPQRGTGAMLRKGQSFSEAMSLGEPTTPKAKLVADDEMVQSFFAKAHGSSFDPNSRADKAKMQKILDMVNSDPKLMSLTPGKFAVKLYASK